MPAKDIYQDTVKNALIKDGWVIWGENFHIQVDEESLAMFIDLVADELIGAEKNDRSGSKKFSRRVKAISISCCSRSISKYSFCPKRNLTRVDSLSRGKFRRL